MSSNEPETPDDSERPPPGSETMAAPGSETMAAPPSGGPTRSSNETVAAPGGWGPPGSSGWTGQPGQQAPPGSGWAQPPSTAPGYPAGQNPGYAPGQNPGYATGQNPGYATGQNPGYAPGQNPGYMTGGQGQQPYGYGGGTPPPGSTGSGPAGGSPGGSRTLLLAGIGAGVAVLAIALVVALVLRGDDEPETATGDTTADTAAGDTTTSTAPAAEAPDARIGTTVRGVDLQTGDCMDYDTTAVVIVTFDLVACDGPHVAEVTGMIEHPQAAQEFPGTDELSRFADDCGPVSDDYLGIDSFQTELVAYSLIPDATDWGEGMYQVACMAGDLSGEPLTQSVAGIGADFPRGEEVPVVRLAVGDCFGGLDPSAEILSISVTDSVSLLPCDDHHPGFFFGRSVLHEFGSDAPWPGDEAVDVSSDAACDVQFTRWFGIGTDAGFKYRFWRPTADTWAAGERSVYCMVADDRGLPPDLDFSDWVPVSLQPLATCFVFPPDTEYTTLDSNLHVNDVPCEAFHHGEVFGAGELPEGPFPADVVGDTNAACETHFVDYVGRASTGSYYQSYVFWSPLQETWEDAGGRAYSCSLLAVIPIEGSARGTNR